MRGVIRRNAGFPAGLLLAFGAFTAASGQAVRLTHDGLDKHRPCWSHDGTKLLFARQSSDGANIWQYVLDAGSGAVKRLAERDTRVEYNGVFSPDDRNVLFAAISLSGTQGNVDIATIGADGLGFRVLVGDQGKLAHQDWPSWSPDGSRFAFSSTHEGNQEIYTARSDGTDLVRLTQSPGQDAHPCWSPRGDGIVFATDRWGGLELASVQPDGSGLTRLTESPGFDDYPAVSPDGRHVAFVSNRDGQYEVYVIGIDGREPRNLSNHPARDTFPTWTPDGRGVTIVSDRDGAPDLYTLRFLP
jgi:TolB protein